MVTCCVCLGCCCGCCCVYCLCDALKPLKATVCLVVFCVLRYILVNSDLYQQLTLETSLESLNSAVSVDLYADSSVWKSVFLCFLVVTAVLLVPRQRRGMALARGSCWLLFLYGSNWTGQVRDWVGEMTWYWVWIAAQYLFLAKTWEEIYSYRLPHFLSIPVYCLLSYLYLYFPCVSALLPAFPSLWELCCALFSLCLRYIGVLFVYFWAALLASTAHFSLSKAKSRPQSLSALYDSSISLISALCVLAVLVLWLSLAPWLYELLDWEPPWALVVVDPLGVAMVVAVWRPETQKWALAGEIVTLGLSIEVWKALLNCF